MKFMYRIGLSSCGKTINEDLFKQYSDSGIEAMELTIKYDTIMEQDYKQIASLAKKYNIDLWSFHLPFQPYGVMDISLPHTYKATIEYFREIIKKVSDIGVDKFVIHPSGEPITDDKRKEYMECAKNSLGELAAIAKGCGSVIAVEDLPRTCLGNCSAEILELISVDDSLRVCFDTNHLLTENIPDFIRAVGDKIITTHISDYDFTNEKHWLPGEGKVDWNELLNTLKATDYSGVWMYEINFVAPNTISRSRDLNCMDFKRNATEIFENKPLTIIK